MSYVTSGRTESEACAAVAWNRPLYAHNCDALRSNFGEIFPRSLGANLAGYYDNGRLKPYAFDYYTQVISYMSTNGFHYTGWAWWVENDHP